jgi:hypothetical protein
MMTSKLKLLAALALSCAVALGYMRTFARSSDGRNPVGTSNPVSPTPGKARETPAEGGLALVRQETKAPALTPDEILDSVSVKARGLPPEIVQSRERDIHNFAVDLEKYARVVREQQEKGNTKLALDCLRQIEFLTEGLRGKLTMGRWEEYKAAERKGLPANAPPPPPVIPPLPPR